MPETTVAGTYVDAENQMLSASNGVDYAYRTTGEGDAPPLVTLQHFRGNLDNWDPALIDALAHERPVITFDNRGVAASSGRTPNTIAQMALDAVDFIDALEVGDVDLLGFSIGSFVAQEIALIRPSTVRKVVLASSAPQGASGMRLLRRAFVAGGGCLPCAEAVAQSPAADRFCRERTKTLFAGGQIAPATRSIAVRPGYRASAKTCSQRSCDFCMRPFLCATASADCRARHRHPGARMIGAVAKQSSGRHRSTRPPPPR